MRSYDVIGSAGGEQVLVPTKPEQQQPPPTPNIREELIEALKGLTIKFELRINDVVDANADNLQFDAPHSELVDSVEPSISVPDVARPDTTESLNQVNGGGSTEDKENDSREDGSAMLLRPSVQVQPVQDSRQNDSSSAQTIIHPNMPPEWINESKSNIRVQDSRQNDSSSTQTTIHPNMPPKLINEFKSNIRPLSSLRPKPDVSTPKLNFTPFQVLKKQAENSVSKSPSIHPPPKRPTLANPVRSGHADGLPATKSPPPNSRHTELGGPSVVSPTCLKTVKTPVVTPKTETTSSDGGGIHQINGTTMSVDVEEPARPTIKYGSAEVGSTISTCLLNYGEDNSFSYITYSDAAVLDVSTKLEEYAADIEALPRMRSVNVHDVVLAKSDEDQVWYRAKVLEVAGSRITLDYLDWGTSETLDTSRIRFLNISSLSLVTKPACAIKAKFTNDPDELETLFDSGFKAKVISFNESDAIYTVTAFT